MENSLSGQLHLCGKAAEYVGHWTLAGETLEWYINGKKYSIESGEDLSRGIESFLKILGKREFAEPLELHACLTCKNFLMSGMAREMSRGQRGVCVLHQTGVEVCFLCSVYERKNVDN